MKYLTRNKITDSSCIAQLNNTLGNKAVCKMTSSKSLARTTQCYVLVGVLNYGRKLCLLNTKAITTENEARSKDIKISHHDRRVLVAYEIILEAINGH